ncbi:DUF1328 domain-containing protein [Rhodobacteraceae bacterium CCMM004]|nr:DUF1328 domain-containing protein [Rhodobacteraceae bacterium CCMM004]
MPLLAGAFLMLALVSGLAGFGGAPASFAGPAQLLFFVFVTGFVLAAIFRFTR